MQIGQQLQRFAPIGAKLGLAAQGSAGIETERRDLVRRHLAVLGIERQHALQIAGIPGGDPFPAEGGQIRGVVMLTWHGFLLLAIWSN